MWISVQLEARATLLINTIFYNKGPPDIQTLVHPVVKDVN